MHPTIDSTKRASYAGNGMSFTQEAETKRAADQMFPLERLPNMLIEHALSYLNLTTLGDCRRLNKRCRSLVMKESFLWRVYTEGSFGERKWAIFLGDVKAKSRLPRNIHEIMQEECPFWPGKKVIETHMLLLIPAKVDSMPLTLKGLDFLGRKPRQGRPKQYDKTSWELVCEMMNQPAGMSVEKTQWVLMTKELLPGSHSLSYLDQCALLENSNTKQKVKYVVPRAIELAVAHFAKGISSEQPLHGLLNYSRCQETREDQQLAIAGSKTKCIISAPPDDSTVGIAALREV